MRLPDGLSRIAVAVHHLVFDPYSWRILFSELMIGDARLFVVDEYPEQGALSPLTLGGSPVALHLYVAEVDGAYRRAVDAGMTVDIPLADFFWGERYALLHDPFGHRWGLASRIEDLSPSQIRERAVAFYGKHRA